MKLEIGKIYKSYTKYHVLWAAEVFDKDHADLNSPFSLMSDGLYLHEPFLILECKNSKNDRYTRYKILFIKNTEIKILFKDKYERTIDHFKEVKEDD